MFTKRVFTHTMSPDFKKYLEDRVAAEGGITLWDNFRGFDGVHVYKRDDYYFFELYDKPDRGLRFGVSDGNYTAGLYSYIKIKLTESATGNIETLFEFDIDRSYKIIMAVVVLLFFLFMLIVVGNVVFSFFLVLMLVGAYWMEKRAFMACFNAVIRPYIV